MEFQDVIVKVFSDSVKPPNSVKLEFINDEMTMRDIFEALLGFTVGGMKLLFSKDSVTVNIGELSDENIQTIIGHIRSIGFNLIITKYTREEFYQNIFPYFTPFNNIPYDTNEKNLEIFQYNISDNINNNEYIISFANSF